jgi:hypothetical protein
MPPTLSDLYGKLEHRTPRKGGFMKLHLLIPKTLTAALAMAVLALSVSCLYPGPWRDGGWRGHDHYHRR